MIAPLGLKETCLQPQYDKDMVLYEEQRDKRLVPAEEFRPHCGDHHVKGTTPTTAASPAAGR